MSSPACVSPGVWRRAVVAQERLRIPRSLRIIGLAAQRRQETVLQFWATVEATQRDLGTLALHDPVDWNVYIDMHTDGSAHASLVLIPVRPEGRRYAVALDMGTRHSLAPRSDKVPVERGPLHVFPRCRARPAAFVEPCSHRRLLLQGCVRQRSLHDIAELALRRVLRMPYFSWLTGPNCHTFCSAMVHEDLGIPRRAGPTVRRWWTCLQRAVDSVC
jgi:hypothetical protein